jgi:hypothetical protein
MTRFAMFQSTSFYKGERQRRKTKTCAASPLLSLSLSKKEEKKRILEKIKEAKN